MEGFILAVGGTLLVWQDEKSMDMPVYKLDGNKLIASISLKSLVSEQHTQK